MSNFFINFLVFQEINHQIFADWSNFMNKSVKIIGSYHPFRLALDFSITFMGRRSVVLCGHSRAVGRSEIQGVGGRGHNLPPQCIVVVFYNSLPLMK